MVFPYRGLANGTYRRAGRPHAAVFFDQHGGCQVVYNELIPKLREICLAEASIGEVERQLGGAGSNRVYHTQEAIQRLLEGYRPRKRFSSSSCTGNSGLAATTRPSRRKFSGRPTRTAAIPRIWCTLLLTRFPATPESSWSKYRRRCSIFAYA